jgi:hypothetical protein
MTGGGEEEMRMDDGARRYCGLDIVYCTAGDRRMIQCTVY